MTQSKGLPILYKLYAIVNHEGYSCRSGHYVSFTLRHGQWLSLNDSFVSPNIYYIYMHIINDVYCLSLI